jgi:hypothetical protein
MLRWRHSGRKNVDLSVCLGDSRDVGEVDMRSYLRPSY